MIALCWWVFWVGFWSDLCRCEERPSAEVVSFSEWRQAHRGRGHGGRAA